MVALLFDIVSERKRSRTNGEWGHPHPQSFSREREGGGDSVLTGFKCSSTAFLGGVTGEGLVWEVRPDS